MSSPEIRSTDLFKTSLINLSAAQRTALSISYSLEAINLFESADLCKQIAFGAFALTIFSGFITGLEKKKVERQESQEKDAGSWTGAVCLISFLATGFFAWQYISLDLEGNRLRDLSEFVVEWVQG